MSNKIFRPFISLFLALVVTFAGVNSALAADGTLDPTFGSGGKVTTDFGNSHEFVNAVALQPDGKIVVAGYSFNTSGSDVALARYNSDGSLDTTFDTDGKVTTDFVGLDSGAAVALQPDGRIIVAGFSNSDFALARYNSDGSLDTTFDSDGKVTTDFGSRDTGNTIALQADGRIVVAGSSDNGSGDKLALARYNSDGSLDTTFDTDGKVTTDFGNGKAVALQPDGKIVVAGYSHNGNNNDFALTRYNTDGSLDTTFGIDGKVTTDFGRHDAGTAVALQSDGRIVVAGSSNSFGDADDVADFALARYNLDGSLDISFGSDGKVTTDFGNSIDWGNAVALQPDGKIVVAGSGSIGNGYDFALARYNSNGSLDATFDADGRVTSEFGSSDDIAYAVRLQPDGKIVTAGSSFNGIDQNFALSRYEASIPALVTVPVPGTGNPWLSGMPDGTLSLFGDSAPANSPAEVLGLPITAGASLFFSVTGLISHGPPGDPLILTSGPDGGTNILLHDFGPENGISDIQAPINALLGVFLGSNQPNVLPPASALDFSTAASRDYLSLTPQLQQVFFIGYGLTTTGLVQQIIIPAGATRLFVGPMDASQYNNNEGSFTVQVSDSQLVGVTIDIKPGRFPNRIELEKNVCKDDDNLYVAILTTPTFDALTVDASTLKLGDPNLSRTVSAIRSRLRDVDLDGDNDLAVAFSLCKLVNREALKISTTELVLKGSTLDGNNFTARDSVKVVR